MPEPRRNPSRLFPALGVVAGAALAIFELRLLWQGSGGEAWFWLGVAVLMLVLGTFGLLDRGEDRDR